MVSRKSSPSDTKEQAVRIREAWSNIGQSIVFGEMTLADLQAALAALEATETTIANLEDQLTSARNELYERRYVLWNQIKGARAWVKAQYGDDSDEYERFGCTRMSERKLGRPARPDGET
jgi:hypothetical protein